GPHVFPMTKYAAVRRVLEAEGLVRASDVILPSPARHDELARVHTAAYLDDMRQLRWTHRTQPSELPLDAPIVDAYVLAAGGTLRASREALERGSAIHLGGGFHHAFADHAEGF